MDIAIFYAEAPCMNPNRDLIKGVVCGIRVENIEEIIDESVERDILLVKAPLLAEYSFFYFT
ncbi:MAG: DUF2200 family protein [Bacteroidaceae bacterium]|nr:DUF2200 family protein [Bacteroidaceae bacterium]